MKSKIAKILGNARTSQVQERADSRGIENPWKEAHAQAKRELPGGTEDELITRAAVRVQQMVGLNPRIQKQDPAEPPAQPAPVQDPTPEPVQPAADV